VRVVRRREFEETLLLREPSETPTICESSRQGGFPFLATMFWPMVGPRQRPHRRAHWSTAITRRRDKSTSSRQPLSSRVTVNAPG
jgi:hypothetical protein